MMFNEFLSEVTAKATEKAVKSNGTATIHRKGEKPKDTETEMFIRNTNMKYFRTESDELMGDFIEMTVPDIQNGDSFIRFDVNYLYELYSRNGWKAVEEHIDSNMSYMRRVRNDASMVINEMNSYQKIKEKLIIRPLNLKNNRIQLENYVYKTIGDIALVLYAVILDDAENSCLNTVKIPKEIFEKWDMDSDNVFLATMLNTNVFAMPRIYTNLLDIEKTTEKESAFMASDYTKKLKAETIPLVTTTRKTNGAIALFYPGVKEKIAEMFEDSFYVAFTSLHEAMIHKAGTIDPSSIRRHVKATNDTFGPEDTLSDEVYFYNAETKTFEVA